MWQWVSHQHSMKGISNIIQIHDRKYINIKTRQDPTTHTSSSWICTKLCISGTKKYMKSTHHIPHIEDDWRMGCCAVGSEITITIMVSKGVKSTTHSLETDTCNFTSKSDQKIESSNGKSECAIRFVALNGAKLTIHFLHSNEVKILGKKESFRFP